MKIVSSGRVLNSREFYEKKKKIRNLKLILVSAGLILVVALLVYLSRLEKLLITEVSITAEDVIDKQEIIQTVQSIIKGHYLWLVPKSNVLIYPRTTVKNSLYEKFPRLKSINLNLEGEQSLFITVEERKPFALYCPEKDLSECFFLDEEGLIFARAPSFSGGAVYFVYTTKEKLENPLGNRFVTREEFESLRRFIEALNIIGIDTIALEEGNEEYRLRLSAGGEIIWKKSADFALLLSNLEAFLTDDSIKAQKDFLNKIESLDLRIENKVFYRFK